MIRFHFGFLFMSALMCMGQTAVPSNAGASAQSLEANAKALEQKLKSIGRVSWKRVDYAKRKTLADEGYKKGYGEAKFKSKGKDTESWQEASLFSIDSHSCKMTVETRTYNPAPPKLKVASNCRPFIGCKVDHLTPPVVGPEGEHIDSKIVFLEEIATVPVVKSLEWEAKANPEPEGYRFDMQPMPYSVVFGPGDFKVPDEQTARQIAAQLEQVGAQCRELSPPPVDRGRIGGPSLDETLKFIATKLNEQGAVSWTQTSQSDPSDTSRMSEHLSAASGNSKACVLMFREAFGSKSMIETDKAISFRRVTKIQVSDAQAGTAGLILAPNFAYLTITKDSGSESLVMRDADFADHVAKAMVHAVELCGGGSKDLF